MPRKWTEYGFEESDNEKVYEGFNKNWQNPSEVEKILLVKVEDTIEIFVMDEGRKAETEIVRFLSENDRYENAEIIGRFKRE